MQKTCTFLKWSLALVACVSFISSGLPDRRPTAAATSALPQQEEILQSLRLANSYFMNKWPDPGKEISTHAGRPGDAWTRSIYYEGLMALCSVDPRRAYHDYAVEWGRSAGIKAGIDNILPEGKSDDWRSIDAVQMSILVRVLSILPQKDPHRPEYLEDYLDMVKALVAVQRPDGFWNVSLHDSTHFIGNELTGTALFTYGIAWGIRQGYLDKKTFLPLVAAAWNAMLEHDKLSDFEDFELGCFLLAGSQVYLVAGPPAANLDEAKVPPYREPDPLAMADGSRLTTVREWEKQQRPHIYDLFAKNVYGRMPSRQIPVSYSVQAVDSNALDGLAIRKVLTIHFSPSDTAARLSLVLYLPRKTRRPVPVFVGYNFEGNDSVKESPQWPLKEILSRGYGVATAWYWDLEPDRSDGWQTGIRTRLSDLLQIEPNEWSAIGAWAWGLERIADYLQTDKRVDPRKLIVIGHSRLGKSALWAGASDPRFAIVVSNESGEGGAALSKRYYGETTAIINTTFPYWFASAYKQYDNNADALPLDQHMLLSLIAPRPLYVASAEGDQWSDPKGEFLSAQMAGPVYQLYREKGIGPDSMPPVGHPVGDFVRYHIRTGKHDITLYDWQQYMDFADRHFKSHIGIGMRTEK